MRKLFIILISCLMVISFSSCGNEKQVEQDEKIGGFFQQTNYYREYFFKCDDYYTNHQEEEKAKIRKQIPNITDDVVDAILKWEARYESDPELTMNKLQEIRDKASQMNMTPQEYLMDINDLEFLDDQGTIYEDDTIVRRCFVINGCILDVLEKTKKESEKTNWYSVPYQINYDDLFVKNYNYEEVSNEYYDYYYDLYRLNIFYNIKKDKHKENELIQISKQISYETWFGSGKTTHDEFDHELVESVLAVETRIENDYLSILPLIDYQKKCAEKAGMSYIEYLVKDQYNIEVDDFSIDMVNEMLSSEKEYVRLFILNDTFIIKHSILKNLPQTSIEEWKSIPTDIYYEELYRITGDLGYPTIDELNNSVYADKIE